MIMPYLLFTMGSITSMVAKNIFMIYTILVFIFITFKKINIITANNIKYFAYDYSATGSFASTLVS